MSTIIVPTTTLPKQFEPFVENLKGTRKILPKFRNRLSSNLASVLQKNETFNAQVYSFPLKENAKIDDKEVQVIEEIEDPHEQGKVIRTYIHLAGPQTQFFNSKIYKLTSEQLEQVLNQFKSEEGDEVAKSFLLSTFNSYEQLKQSGVDHLLTSTQPEIVEQQQCQVFGSSLLEVPTLDQKSGNWTNTKTTSLKIETKIKQ